MSHSQENPSEEDAAVVDKIMSSRIVKKEVMILVDCFFSCFLVSVKVPVVSHIVSSELLKSLIVYPSVFLNLSTGLSRSADRSRGVFCKIQKLVSSLFSYSLCFFMKP